ncbi:MAG: archaeosine biosynthesis radical SAM protein RaSEA [Methanosarcinaceae archaeon]|nr:archaeosine biosynthesis radical SAM protein RaSEA [Methanosarcinaceae archaeon]
MTLNNAVLEIRNHQRIKPSASDVPSAVWTGVDLFNGREINTLTTIFKTSGCWWGRLGGCTMCGFVYDSAQTPPSEADLEAQLDRALTRAAGFDEFMVKIFTSGSFLDEREIQPDVRKSILRCLGNDERIPKVLVETRPEFVKDDVMVDCMDVLGDTKFEIAIGLETSSDLIRKDSINKGFTYLDFVDAAETVKRHGATTKVYLLLKPPFLSEGEALDDMVRSVEVAAHYSDTFSINLCNVQRGTFVESLWQKGQYRPPWLWTIVEVLKRTKKAHPDTVIMSDPVGAGSKRGPHNCRKCSHEVADAIRKFSITQDVGVFDNLSCDCIELWEKVIELDDYTYGAAILD